MCQATPIVAGVMIRVKRRIDVPSLQRIFFRAIFLGAFGPYTKKKTMTSMSKVYPPPGIILCMRQANER